MAHVWSTLITLVKREFLLYQIMLTRFLFFRGVCTGTAALILGAWRLFM